MHENSSTMRERLEYIYLYTFFAHVFYPLTICNAVWNREFVTVFVLFLICTFDTYKHTNTHFFWLFPRNKRVCVRVCFFSFPLRSVLFAVMLTFTWLCFIAQ